MSNTSQFLYRIMNFRHVVDLFETGELYFGSPDSWEDPYEHQLVHKRSKMFFAQCWCKRSVSDAMWRIYSPDRTGIRIRTSRSTLREALASAKDASNIGYLIADVKYLRASEARDQMNAVVRDIKKKYDARRAVDALLIKRDAFDHEAEVRVIVHDKAKAAPPEPRTALRVAVDAHTLVESIYFDPRVDPIFEKVCTHYLRHALKYKGPIDRSSLYSQHSQIIVE